MDQGYSNEEIILRYWDGTDEKVQLVSFGIVP